MDYLKDPVLVFKIQNYFGVIPNNRLTDKKTDNSIHKEYIITNKFWYYLFLFGTALGDELFYSSFIPFWFWNVDGAVGRRVILIWAIVMYIGQSVKDILQWPRPGHPVLKLNDKWSLEYGMPSTHAMVGVSIPFSIFFCTMNRYEYFTPAVLVIAILWFGLISLSRLYLGMHTVLDVIVGLLLATVIMTPLMLFNDIIDDYLITSPSSPSLQLIVSILLIIYYPSPSKWTPTRGDTTMIVSVCVGVHIGAWLNYKTGVMVPSELNSPYTVLWPTFPMLGLMLLRTIIGFTIVLLIRAISKIGSYHIFCALLRENVDDLKKSKNSLFNKSKTFVDLGCKYITCGIIGFNTVYLLPQLFRYLRIERPTFYTEI